MNDLAVWRFGSSGEMLAGAVWQACKKSRPIDSHQNSNNSFRDKLPKIAYLRVDINECHDDRYNMTAPRTCLTARDGMCDPKS